MTTGPVAARRSKNVRQAPKSCCDPTPGIEAQQREHGGLDPGALGGVGDVLLEHGRDGRPRGRLVGVLLEPGAAADHLAERPEADAVAVGGAATVVPPDVLDEPVDVLEELPGQARLADAGRAHDADEADAALAGRGVEVVLELAQLLVAPDEGRLERLRPPDAAALCDHAERAPGGHGADLALEDLVGRRLEDDGAAGRALGRLADEHGRRRRHALESAGRVDHVAADHALVGRAEGDGRLAGHDAGPDLDPGAQATYRVDQVEAPPGRPARRRPRGRSGRPRAPSRHRR